MRNQASWLYLYNLGQHLTFEEAVQICNNEGKKQKKNLTPQNQLIVVGTFPHSVGKSRSSTKEALKVRLIVIDTGVVPIKWVIKPH